MLEAVAKAGQRYTASFALQAAEYGENQGRIVAVLTGLTPIAEIAIPPALRRQQPTA